MVGPGDEVDMRFYSEITALDGLLRRSTVIKINGESYRVMEKKKAGVNLAKEEAKQAPKD